MHYTDRTCTVSPYDDQEYKPVTDVPIVQAATGFTSSNGRNYILIINEALSMPSLDHSLWNPNQMRGHGVEVNDNPYGDEPMSISSLDENMVACLQHDGTTIFLNTWTPTETDLSLYPHIILTSPHPWDPQNVRFPETPYSVKEEIEMRSVSALRQDQYLHLGSMIGHQGGTIGFRELDHMEESPCSEDVIMNVGDLNHRIIQSIQTSDIKMKVSSASTKKRKRAQAQTQQASGVLSEESM